MNNEIRRHVQVNKKETGMTFCNSEHNLLFAEISLRATFNMSFLRVFIYSLPSSAAASSSCLLRVYIMNPKNQVFMLNTHFIWLWSTGALLEELHKIFLRKLQILDTIKTNFFTVISFVFTNIIAIKKIFVVTQLFRCYYTVTKEVGVKRSSH